MQIVPPTRFKARVRQVFEPATPDGFATAPALSLTLDFDGLPAGRHRGPTRRSGGREPWYPRGSEIRNERQISIVSLDDLRDIGAALDVPVVRPEWMGASLLVEGVRRLTLLPPRTGLFFEGGATIRIDGLNKPCRVTGRAIAAHYPDRPDLELRFVAAARYLRGLVGWVERPGAVRTGEPLEVRVPEHWLYEASADDGLQPSFEFAASVSAGRVDSLA